LAITIATAVAIVLGPVSFVAFPARAYVALTIEEVLLIVYSLTVVVAVVEGAMNCEPAYRLQSLVAGSTLILLSAVNIVFSVFSLAHWTLDPTWFLLLQYAAGIGVTYAVLRHRLVDLNLIISRAAIFSVVSLVLICLFVITEWALALVLERAIGPKFGAQGQTVLTGLIALGVGLSARNIHGAVERRLNRVFFARRYRALSELQRFAHETDAATDAGALIDLTVEQLRRNLDATYVSIYTGRPETGYTALQNSAPVGLHCLDQNHALVLRLRRWGESFVNEIPGDVFGESLVCPMMLRGTLYGFVVCGAKRDRTSYLPDERETLESLFHRVGIAYEWLTRQSTPAPSGRLRALSKERIEDLPPDVQMPIES
jgi:hypothetical protein